MAGCSKSEYTTPYVEQTTLSFDTDDDWTAISALTSRGEAKTGFALGDEIGIFAYHIQSDESIENLTPNFMYNQLVSYEQLDNSFAWQYSPVKYWPNNTTDSLQFFAYYPYCTSSSGDNEAKIEFSTSSEEGYPTINFTQAENIGEQIDFMTAQTEPLAKCDVVSLSFEHQLTKVSFAARHNGVSTDLIYVTKVVVKIKNAINAMKGEFTNEGFVAQTDESNTVSLEYELTTENGYLNSTYGYRIPTLEENFYRTVNSSSGTLMLLPQTIASESVTIEVTVSINRGWNEEDETVTDDTVTGEKTLYLIVKDQHDYSAGGAIVDQFTLDLETSEVGMDIENIVRELWNETGEDIGADNTNDEVGSIW